MRLFITALQFLTWITVRDVEVNDDSFARSMMFYPLVGLVVGVFLTAVYLLGSMVLPAGVVAALLIAAGVMISGGLHLDGFMDTMDGLFSGRSRERVLEIMKDSRVGAHSVIAISSLFLIKYGLYASLAGTGAVFTLLAMPMVGRWGITWGICRYPYGRESGLGKVYGGRVGTRELVLTTVYTLAFLVVFLRLGGLVVAAVSLLAAIGFCRMVSRKLGGMTGDTYGAINEILEVIVLLTVQILTLNHWLM